jgi:hypothetical protein
MTGCFAFWESAHSKRGILEWLGQKVRQDALKKPNHLHHQYIACIAHSSQSWFKCEKIRYACTEA